MSRKFESLFSFSKRQGLLIFILLMIILSVNSFAAITYADESSTDPENISQTDSNSNNTNDTAASETQEQSSETDTNSTSITQSDEDDDSASDEGEQTSQNSTVSEPERQEGNSTSSSVSDSQGTNQTSSSATAVYNETASSNSNSTETLEESASDDYQNINSTSTTSNSTTSHPDQQQNENSTVGSGNNNSTNSNNGSGIIPSTNNSTNYNNSTQTMDNTAAENSSNQNTTVIATGNNNSTSQALNQNVTTSATSHFAPDFMISIDPLTMNVNAGSSATYSIVVSSVNGFNSNVSLTIISSAIPGVTASLGSNITRPPVNASSITLLAIQSDVTAHSGKYKLKVTGSAANVTGTRAASVTLEVIGQNVTAASGNDTLGLDAVALTPILIKDIEDNDVFKYYGGMSAEKTVFISTTVVNNYNKTQQFILVMEIRDEAHKTLVIQLLRGVLNPDGQLEFDISWMPGKAGSYEIRSFVIDHLPDPAPLSAVIGRTYAVY